MFRNYFKVALRQLQRQGFYSGIKIGGFALGIATCLLVSLYIRNELSYDNRYAHGDRIYRVMVDYKQDDGKLGKGPSTSPPFAKAFKVDYPMVEESGRIMPYPLFEGAGHNQVKPAGKTQDTYEDGFTWSDPQILDILEIPMVFGDRAHALANPNSIVISKRKADKYFPGQDPIGKVFYFNDDNTKPYTIGGVMQDPPTTSHFQYDFLLSLTGHELWKGEQSMWPSQNYDVYVRLKPGADPIALAKQMKTMNDKYIYPGLVAIGMTNARKIADRVSYELQPVKDIHLYSYDIHDSTHHGDIRFVWLVAFVGIFILLLACVNFINLSTARSANRAKEVGLRKVVGSQRRGLVLQFLTESVVLSCCSFLLAIGLAWILLPVFNRIIDADLTFPWSEWRLIPLILLTATAIGMLAGLYPAVYLSRFRPAEVLKGQLSTGTRGAGLRSVLVIFQFTTSMILIIATFVVYRQMNLILNHDLGYNKDQVMLIEGTGPLNQQQWTLKTELQKLQGVKSVAVSDFLPVSGGKRNMQSFWKWGREKVDDRVGAQSWWVDGDYFSTMGMKVIQGRPFSKSMASDSSAIVINQKMASKMGLKDPVGAEVGDGSTFKMHVVGVVADFNFESIKDSIGPLVLHLTNWSSVIAVKADTRDIAGLIRNVGVLWKKFSPQQELRYSFLDEGFAVMYADVQRTQRIFTTLATLAIVIACLGLFALSAFMAEQRRKEIGIRKVLGATVGQLTGLLSRDFIKLVIISIVIASPVAYWVMHKWLQDYLYRTDLGLWLFLVAGGMLMMIALLTISVQAVRTALANPVNSLRSE